MKTLTGLDLSTSPTKAADEKQQIPSAKDAIDVNLENVMAILLVGNQYAS